MEEEELAKDLVEIDALRFGDFWLKSGKKSPYYIDLRIVPSFPEVIRRVGRVMSDMIVNLPEQPTRLCAIPQAGVPIADEIGRNLNLPVCQTRKDPIINKEMTATLKDMLRANEFSQDELPGVKSVIKFFEEQSGPKSHGIARYVDGVLKDGDRIQLVDDLITDAGAKLEATDMVMRECEQLRINAKVIGVAVLIDREQGGREALEKAGIPLHAAMTIREAVRSLEAQNTLGRDQCQKILDYTAAQRSEMGLDKKPMKI